MLIPWSMERGYHFLISGDMNRDEIQAMIRQELLQMSNSAGFSVKYATQHLHTGTDSPQFPFTNLRDVPNSYYKSAGQILGVNSGATGLEFITGMVWSDTNTQLQVIGQYSSLEYDNGNIATTATINWNNGNVQYATMTGNVTLTFTNPIAGGRYLIQLAGAFTPTFPASVRWSGGTTPTATATSGHKDLYTMIYSGKEALYDVLQSPNYAIT